MSFITNLIKTKKITIVDIGTYIVRAMICELKEGKINVLGYGEKRQEIIDIIHWEIGNLEWVCNTIEEAISKASSQAWQITKDIVLNAPTSIVVSEANTISYKRDNPNREIDIVELDHIIWKIEKLSIQKAEKNIEEKTWYKNLDMKLITSSITKITIDGQKITNPIWFKWENIVVSILNIFIPYSKYNNLQTIWNFLKKNLVSIIPLEFSISKLLEKSDYAFDDVVYLDIGNIRTTIVVQIGWSIVWLSRMEMGIDDLIRSLSVKYNIPKIKITKEIDDDKYTFEKQEFADIWWDWVITALGDISSSEIIPHKFFLTGWWDNDFLRKTFKNINLNKYHLKTMKPIEILDIDLSNIDINCKEEIFCKSNLWLLSQVLATKEILNLKKDPLVEILKWVVKKIKL